MFDTTLCRVLFPAVAVVPVAVVAALVPVAEMVTSALVAGLMMVLSHRCCRVLGIRKSPGPGDVVGEGSIVCFLERKRERGVLALVYVHFIHFGGGI